MTHNTIPSYSDLPELGDLKIRFLEPSSVHMETTKPNGQRVQVKFYMDDDDTSQHVNCAYWNALMTLGVFRECDCTPEKRCAEHEKWTEDLSYLWGETA